MKKFLAIIAEFIWGRHTGWRFTILIGAALQILTDALLFLPVMLICGVIDILCIIYHDPQHMMQETIKLMFWGVAIPFRCAFVPTWYDVRPTLETMAEKHAPHIYRKYVA